MFNHLIERDPIFQNLEDTLREKVNNICKDSKEELNFRDKNLEIVSFEDALKELLTFKKNI